MAVGRTMLSSPLLPRPSRAPAIEADVSISWRGDELLRHRVRNGETAGLGDIDGSLARIPCSTLGLEGFHLVRVERGETSIQAPRGTRARLERPDGTAELIPSSTDLWLMPDEVVRLRVARFTITVTAVRTDVAVSPAQTFRGWVRRFPGGQLGLSAAVHAMVLLVALLWPSSQPKPAVMETPPLEIAQVAQILAPPPPPALPAEDDGSTWHDDGDAWGPAETPLGEALGEALQQAPMEPNAGRAWEQSVRRAAPPGAEIRDEAEAGGGSFSEWWAGAGALALAGLAGWRGRRALREERSRPCRWSWAGALELGRQVSRRREHVGRMGASPDGVGEGSEAGSEAGSGQARSFDVLGLQVGDALAEADLSAAWRAVRAGGVLVLGSSRRGEGRAFAEKAAKRTGARIAWWFESGRGLVAEGRAAEREGAAEREAKDLSTIVLLAKGRPARGPREVLASCIEERQPAAREAAAMAARFGGWVTPDGAPASDCDAVADAAGCFT